MYYLSIGVYDVFIPNNYNFEINEQVKHFTEIQSSEVRPITYLNNNNDQFVFDFINKQNIYPFVCSFQPLKKHIKEYTEILESNNLQYDLLSEMVQTLDNKYVKSDCFCVRIKSVQDFKKIFSFVYDLASSNFFVGFFLSEKFELKLRNGYPIVSLSNGFPFITFSHDAKGMLIFGRSNEWLDIKEISMKMPDSVEIDETIKWKYNGISFEEN